MKTRILTALFFCSAVATLSGCTAKDILPESLNSKADIKNTAKATLHKIDKRFNKNGQRIVIIPGYGTPVLGNESYEDYIKKAVAYVNDTNNHVVAVIFTGSYTNNKDLSEAESLYRGYDEYADIASLQKKGVKFYKEECAITTWQNIDNSYAIVKDKGIDYDAVTIFGDESRKEKLIGYTGTVFNKDIVKNRSVTSIDYVAHRFSKQTLSDSERGTVFAAEIGAAYNADLRDKLLNDRFADWGKKYKYDVAKNLVSKGCVEFKEYQ